RLHLVFSFEERCCNRYCLIGNGTGSLPIADCNECFDCLAQYLYLFLLISYFLYSCEGLMQKAMGLLNLLLYKKNLCDQEIRLTLFLWYLHQSSDTQAPGYKPSLRQYRQGFRGNIRGH